VAIRSFSAIKHYYCGDYHGMAVFLNAIISNAMSIYCGILTLEKVGIAVLSITLAPRVYLYCVYSFHRPET
jgi:hypothetical protein